MAASKSQGSYLTLFWTGCTVLCAGIAYLAFGFGKLVLAIGLAAIIVSLIGFLKIKPEEGRTAVPAQVASMKLLGTLVTWGGWLVTIAGLHLTQNVGGRLIFALAGIAVSLIGIIGILPVAFGKKVAGKAEPSFVSPKTTMEHSR